MPGEMPGGSVENGAAVTQRVIDDTTLTTGRTGAANELTDPSLIIIGLLRHRDK